jgi:hypothetical protein
VLRQAFRNTCPARFNVFAEFCDITLTGFSGGFESLSRFFKPCSASIGQFALVLLKATDYAAITGLQASTVFGNIVGAWVLLSRVCTVQTPDHDKGRCNDQ